MAIERPMQSRDHLDTQLSYHRKQKIKTYSPTKNQKWVGLTHSSHAQVS